MLRLADRRGARRPGSDHGRAADTPAAVISQGTTLDQETVVGTLTTIAADAARAGLGSPATLVVGEVVRLRAAELVRYDRAHG